MSRFLLRVDRDLEMGFGYLGRRWRWWTVRQRDWCTTWASVRIYFEDVTIILERIGGIPDGGRVCRPRKHKWRVISGGFSDQRTDWLVHRPEMTDSSACVVAAVERDHLGRQFSLLQSRRLNRNSQKEEVSVDNGTNTISYCYSNK